MVLLKVVHPLTTCQNTTLHGPILTGTNYGMTFFLNFVKSNSWI